MKHNWEYKKLGEVCEIKDSQRLPVSQKDRKPGPYPYYGATGIQDFVDDYIFDGNFLLVGEDGAKWGPNDKKAFSIKGKNWVNNHAHVLDFGENEIFQFFIEKYLCFVDLTKYIKGAVVPKLNQKNLIQIPIPVPPTEIQAKVVSELDEINEMIDGRKEQIKLLDQLAQSIFYEMFGDPITNQKGWEECKLELKNEVSSAKRVLIKDVVEYGIPFIRGTELAELSKQASFDPSIFTLFITEEHYEKVKKITGAPVMGDLLIPSINPDGFVWEVNTPSPFYFKDGRVLWVHVNKDVFSSKWLRFTLSKLISEKYKSLSRGAVFAELTLIFLRNLIISVPPIKFQEEFASKIEMIEEQKKDIENSIKELETLLASRMDYWFN